MSDIKVSDHLYRKSTMRDLSGNIINLLDEANGGYIIRNRVVVNPERFAELQKIEQDKREAAKAAQYQITNPNAHLRNKAPSEIKASDIKPVDNSKINQLEKKVEGMESKLDAILEALATKKTRKKK